MAVGKEARGPLWVDGRITLRVRGPGSPPGRIFPIRRPFALIGRDPGADIRIDDPSVEPRHVLLVLDRRGIFGVDLMTGTGTRFAGADSVSAWLGVGDILEIADRRIEILQLRVDGRPIDPPLSQDDPLSPHPGTRDGLVSIALEPMDRDGPPWMLGSAMAIIGRGEACAIRVEDASASTTHCALIRGAEDAHLIDLLGRRTLLNDRPLVGASALLDGDVLTIGESRYAIRVDPPPLARPPRPPGTEVMVREALPVLPTRSDRPGLALADLPPGVLMARLIEAVLQGAGPRQAETLDAVRRLQAATSILRDDQDDRIETMDREIAMLRDELRGRHALPAAPFRLDLGAATTAPTSAESAAWLLGRLDGLESARRPAWRQVLDRIASAVHARTVVATPGGLHQTDVSGPGK